MTPIQNECGWYRQPSVRAEHPALAIAVDLVYAININKDGNLILTIYDPDIRVHLQAKKQTRHLSVPKIRLNAVRWLE